MREVKISNEVLEADSTLSELEFLKKESEDEYLAFSVYPNWDKPFGYKCMTYKVKLTNEDLEKGDVLVYDKLTDNIESDAEFDTMLEAVKAGFAAVGAKISRRLNVFTGSLAAAASETKKGSITAVRIPDYL